jgi:signal recognition particle receptor subunit beta
MKRVAIFGPPLSGKSTLLRGLAQKHGATISTRAASESTTAPVIHFTQVKIDWDVELLTIPGTPWHMADWSPLLQEAQAILVVLDLERNRMEASAAAREYVTAYLTARAHAAILTKADLCKGESTPKCLGIVEAIEKFQLNDWKTFVSSPKEVPFRALDWVLAAASERR